MSKFKDFKNAWATLSLDISSMVVFDQVRYTGNSILIGKAVESLVYTGQSSVFKDYYCELSWLQTKETGVHIEGQVHTDAIYILSTELFSNLKPISQIRFTIWLFSLLCGRVPISSDMHCSL